MLIGSAYRQLNEITAGTSFDREITLVRACQYLPEY
jgi:hypothetical protein